MKKHFIKRLSKAVKYFSDMTYPVPSLSEDQKAVTRKKRELQAKLYSILKLAAIHTIFLISLAIIVSGNMSWQTYLQNEELRNIFLNNKYIKEVRNKSCRYYDWIKVHVIVTILVADQTGNDRTACTCQQQIYIHIFNAHPNLT